MLARAIVAASASVKARLGKLQERASAVRERTALRRQAVLVLARHLAEREREPVGSKHRVVAEAALSARGPHQGAVDPRLEFLGVPVGPGKAQRAELMPGAPPSASTTSPESSANAGRLAAVAAAVALMRAFSPKLRPLSAGSARPSSAADTASTR